MVSTEIDDAGREKRHQTSVAGKTKDIGDNWNVAKKYRLDWNPFSNFLKNHMNQGSELTVTGNASDIVRALRKSRLQTPAKLNAILDDLKQAGVLTAAEHSNGRYRIVFKNQAIRECLWDGGSILELHTYQRMRQDADDCEVGLHLDWDGVIHQKTSQDVLNEIDVIAAKDHILTFVSCKSGATDKKGLYELETVARRFGGRYAKKIFVTSSGVSETDRLRAEEMGVIIKYE